MRLKMDVRCIGLGGAGMGWVLDRQFRSDRILGGAQAGFAISVLHTEVMACILSLRQASQVEFSRVTIFTDSQRLIELLRSIKVTKYPAHLDACRDSEDWTTFLWWCINKVDRQRVHQAHELAKATSTLLFSFSNFPQFVSLSLCPKKIKK